MRDLEPILRYKMDTPESKAYKIALMWEEECAREIPGEAYSKINRKSDPRKSALFKYCYKLAKETSGIIPDSDLQLYVRAQIQVLKAIRDGSIHALIEPHCLVGEKAWKRWKMWKWRRDKKISRPLSANEIDIKTSEGKIKADLSATFDFMSRLGLLEFDSLAAQRENLKRWVSGGEVSCFYVVLSPWMQVLLPDHDDLPVDRTYHRASVTPKAEQFFRELFSHEFEGKEDKCLKAS